MYTEYIEDFTEFHKNMVADIANFKEIKGIYPKPIPENCFGITCLPWLSYTGCSLEIGPHYVVPVTIWGKYEKNGDKIELPFTLRASHAFIDGYHACKLINLIQQICLEFDK